MVDLGTFKWIFLSFFNSKNSKKNIIWVTIKFNIYIDIRISCFTKFKKKHLKF